jgi:hypothetical protein
MQIDSNRGDSPFMFISKNFYPKPAVLREHVIGK